MPNKLMPNKLMFRGLSAVFACISVWMAWQLKEWGMLFAATISGACAIASSETAWKTFLDRFKSGKIGGLEIQLQDKVKEADELILRLNHLSTAVVRPMYSVLARYGRLGADIPRPMRVAMITELDQALRSAGKNDKEIDELKEEIHYFNMLDIYFIVHSKLMSRFQQIGDERASPARSMPQPIPAEKIEAISKVMREAQQVWDLRENLQKSVAVKPYTTMPDRLENYINLAGALKPSERADLLKLISKEIEEMKYYVKHKDFRDKDSWLSYQKR